MRRFSQEEVEFIKENYVKMGRKHCAEILNRSEGTIKSKARSLNIVKYRFNTAYQKENHTECRKCKKVMSFDFFAISYRNNKKRGVCRKCHKEQRRKNKERTKQTYEGTKKLTIKNMITSSRKRAKKKGLEFNLDYEIINSFWNVRCPILDIEYIIGKEAKSYASPTLDRLDNKKGYVKSNINIISHRANALKNNASLEEIGKIIRYFNNYKFTNTGNINTELLNKIEKLYHIARRRAKRCKIEFNIDLQNLLKISTDYCPILNKKFILDKSCVDFLSPSLDRFDNAKGYIEGNVRIISQKMNRIKANGTLEEFEKIYEYMEKNLLTS